jgi:hypothetical protein
MSLTVEKEQAATSALSCVTTAAVTLGSLQFDLGAAMISDSGIWADAARRNLATARKALDEAETHIAKLPAYEKEKAA